MDALDLGDGFDLVAAALADVGAEELAPQQADVLEFDLAASVLEMPPEDEIAMKTSGFAQRSKAIMAYARKCKENRAAASTIRSLKDKLAEVNRRLDAAVSNFPWLSRILQTTKRPLVSRTGEVTQACLESMIRVAHLSSRACRVVERGAYTILCIRTFVVRILLVLQATAFEALYASMEALRANCVGFAAQGGEVATAVAISHSWDETKQMLREPPRSGQRRSTQKIARNILVQRSLVHAFGVVAAPGGKKVEHSRTETIIIPPAELYGKIAKFLLAGLRRGMLFPLFAAERVQAFAEKVTATILSFFGDAASTNRRLMRHFAATAAMEQWPRNVLLDVEEVCLLHQVHRIKVQVIDVHATVSLMYSMSKLVRAGSILHLVADHIANLVEQRCRRVVGPPPPEGSNRMRKALDLIYKLTSAHHFKFGRRGVTQSQLFHDVEAVLRMDNGGDPVHGSDDIVHHCWNGHGPCCASLDETKEKMTAAYLNLFVCHGIPVATLSRWTHIQIMCGILCSAFICRTVFVQALLAGLATAPGAEDRAGRLAAEAAGAGDEDAAVKHRARIAKVRAWLMKHETRMQVSTLFLMLRVLDGITYFFMGGDEEGQQPPRQPGTIPKAEGALPVREVVRRISRALMGFATLLQEYSAQGTASGDFLLCVGLFAAMLGDEGPMRTFRRAMVFASAGVFRRLARRVDGYPLKLWAVVDPEIPEEMRQELVDEFMGLPPCCIGAFGRGLRRLFPTVDSLLSLEGTCALKAWLRSLQWSIYSCEKEHASCRRLCSGDGPGRNWTLVARERVMEQSRAIHVERCCVDPATALAPAPCRKRAAGQEIANDGAIVESVNPLDHCRPELPTELLAWSDSPERQLYNARPEDVPEALAAALAPNLGEIADGNAAGVGRPASKVYNLDEFVVKEELDTPLLGEGLVLEACALLGRTVCQRHPQHDRITTVHNAMKLMCDRLGKQMATSCDALVMLEGSSVFGVAAFERYRFFGLISQVSFKPKFQDWTLCAARPGHAINREVLQLPLRLELGLVPLPSSKYDARDEGAFCLHHETSDDLARMMCDIAGDWTLKVCQYNLISPMEMEVLGFEPNDKFTIRCGEVVHVDGRDLDAGLSAALAAVRALQRLGDPMSVPTSRGLAAVPMAPAREQPPAPQSHADEPATAAAVEANDGLEDIWGGVRSDSDDDGGHGPDGMAAVALERQALIDEALVALGIDLLIPAVDEGDIMVADLADEDEQLPPMDAAAPPAEGSESAGSGLPPASSGGSGLGEAIAILELVLKSAGIGAGDDEAEVNAIVAAAAGEGPTPAAQEPSSGSGGSAANPSVPSASLAESKPVGDPIADGPPGWTMTSGGYVFCDQGRHRGRITYWGPNVFVKCSAHGCSKAKARTKVSEGMLAQWLAQGLTIDDPRGPAAKDLHIRRFPQ